MAFAVDAEAIEMEIQKYKNKISSIDSKISTLNFLKGECELFRVFVSNKYTSVANLYNNIVSINNYLINFRISGKQFLYDEILSFSTEILNLLALIVKYDEYALSIFQFCEQNIFKLHSQKSSYQSSINKLTFSINKGGRV